MYAKEEKQRINTQFWTGFKTFMSRTRSSNGRKMNWLNYPSDVKYIYIRLEVDEKSARFCFDIQAKDDGIRAIIWEQMGELKNLLEAAMGTEGIWIEHASSPSIPAFSRIVWERNGVSLYNYDNYEEIFHFLRDRLVHFDAFYQDFKDILVNLAT